MYVCFKVNLSIYSYTLHYVFKLTLFPLSLIWNLMAATIVLGQAKPNVKLNLQSSKV